MRISDWSSDVCSSDLSSRRIAAVRGILAYRLTEAFNQRRHLGRAQLERRAVDDQPRRHLADDCLLGERIFDERAPGRNQIDDVRGEPELRCDLHRAVRSEEHTSELQSLMRISYAVFCLKKKTIQLTHTLVHSCAHTLIHKHDSTP